MYTPHVVTIFNAYQDDLMRTHNNLTVLDGVFYDASKAANVRMSGLENADSVRLFIPFSVKAYDPVTNEAKTYIEPKAYENLSDKRGYFTLDTDESCFFAKGLVVEESATFKYINANYEAHRITKVDTKDFGSPSLRHWEVGGA